MLHAPSHRANLQKSAYKKVFHRRLEKTGLTVSLNMYNVIRVITITVRRFCPPPNIDDERFKKVMIINRHSRPDTLDCTHTREAKSQCSTDERVPGSIGGASSFRLWKSDLTLVHFFEHDSLATRWSSVYNHHLLSTGIATVAGRRLTILFVNRSMTFQSKSVREANLADVTSTEEVID